MLEGTITSNGSLSLYSTTLSTSSLTVAGLLQAAFARFEGSSVSIEGTHQLINWFGVNAFTGGVSYGSQAVLEWWIGSDQLSDYVDGTTDAERGLVFGAIEVGGSGLIVAEGAQLRVVVPDPSSDPFWLNPKTFKIASLMDGASITGSFLLVTADGSPASGWSAITQADGLYLNWSGVTLPMPVPVPETETMTFVLGIGLLAVCGMRQRRMTHRC